MTYLRADKMIGDCTTFSRKEIKQLIKNGRIAVNGEILSSADKKLDPEKDTVYVDNRRILYKKYHYLMLHKPAGVISATEDKQESTVMELLPQYYRQMGLFPAGRLDKDVEGLLILTDDGEYAHRVISPKNKVFKVYYAEVSGQLNKQDQEAFSAGIQLQDGLQCMPGNLTILSSQEKSTCLVSICEGKYHQVKRMLAALGKPVQYMRRLAIGGLQLDICLKPGEFREMTEEERDFVFADIPFVLDKLWKNAQSKNKGN